MTVRPQTTIHRPSTPRFSPSLHAPREPRSALLWLNNTSASSSIGQVPKTPAPSRLISSESCPPKDRTYPRPAPVLRASECLHIYSDATFCCTVTPSRQGKKYESFTLFTSVPVTLETILLVVDRPMSSSFRQFRLACPAATASGRSRGVAVIRICLTTGALRPCHGKYCRALPALSEHSPEFVPVSGPSPRRNRL